MPDLFARPVDISTERGNFAGLSFGHEEDPIVLCLHGFPDTPDTFRPLARSSAFGGRRLVAPYARGYRPPDRPASAFPKPEESGESVFEVLGRDAVAIARALSPEVPIDLVGHDNGGFTAYHAMSRAPERFARAVTLTAGHPAAVFTNTSKLPHQMWKSRYAFLFQIPKLSDWYAERDGFAYLRELWNRWSGPNWTVPDEHFERVREVMAASWPTPLEHYREMAFEGPEEVISVPTLYLIGEHDGCVEPESARGQARYFAELEERLLPGVGHFPHLEAPDATVPLIAEWLRRA